MVHTVQTSFFTNSKLHEKRYYPGMLFTVIVNTEDGERYEYEVEADTFADATHQTEEMANSLMADITYIEIYSQEYL